MGEAPDDVSSGGRRGLGLIEVAIMFVVLWATAEFVFAALPAARERARRARCRANLKCAIGYVCHLYSGDCEGRLPASISVLFPNCVSDGLCFPCPVGR